MKKFQLTSPTIKGAVECIYDSYDQLQRIDLSGANLTPLQAYNYKNHIPVNANDIQTSFDGSGVKIKQVELAFTFDDFWREYPYKRNRSLAEKFWPKMTSAAQYLAVLAAIEYRKYLERKGWQNPKIADSWLKQKQYENDWKNL